jgi:tRNA U38,U39,U40 pseudouridine synthase TruA
MEIGLNARDLEDIEKILNPESAEAGSVPASAQGLFLQEIEY